MPLTLLRLPLPLGFVAEILADDDHDRLPYIPPPVAKGDHHETCGCEICVSQRALRR